MPNSLKKEIEKEFDKNKNYNAILSKVESTKSRKTLSYVLVSSFVLIVVIVFVSYINIENSKIDNGTTIAEGNDRRVEIELNINKLDCKKYSAMSIDADIKEIKMESVPQNIAFISNITLPENLTLKDSYAIYTTNHMNSKEAIEKQYDLLHDYVFSYSTENHEKDIKIAFSTIDKPLRDYYIDIVEKKSKIGDIEFEISELEGMYIVTFSYNDFNFDIETKGVNQDELVDLLISIMKEVVI